MKSNHVLTVLMSFLFLSAPSLSIADINCRKDGKLLSEEVTGTVEAIESRFFDKEERISIFLNTKTECEADEEDLARVRSIKPGDKLELSFEDIYYVRIKLVQSKNKH